MNPDDVTLPETEAGRKLLGWLQFASRRADGVPRGNTIVDIERQARAFAEERIAEADAMAKWAGEIAEDERAQVATLREALQEAFEWIDRHRTPGDGDWACAKCHPESDILVPSFECAYHRTETLLATPSTDILARIKAEAVAERLTLWRCTQALRLLTGAMQFPRIEESAATLRAALLLENQP